MNNFENNNLTVKIHISIKILELSFRLYSFIHLNSYLCMYYTIM